MSIIDEIMGNETEKPLERLVNDGGFCSIFRTIGCVGDSLSSGEFEATRLDGTTAYIDMYEYSWGQYLARMAGCKVRNFSRGGMSAKAYCDTFAAENGFWDTDKACQAYIIALGVNDIAHIEDMYGGEVGSAQDICVEDYSRNKPNFAGYYAQILQRLKLIQPKAKFFLMTLPRDGRTGQKAVYAKEVTRLLYEFTELFDNTYVLDFEKYAPEYDEAFKQNFYLSNHMNPCGYIVTAKLVASYIDYIIRHNMEDFKQVGFIGTGYVCKEPELWREQMSQKSDTREEK